MCCSALLCCVRFGSVLFRSMFSLYWNCDDDDDDGMVWEFAIYPRINQNNSSAFSTCWFNHVSMPNNLVPSHTPCIPSAQFSFLPRAGCGIRSPVLCSFPTHTCAIFYKQVTFVWFVRGSTNGFRSDFQQHGNSSRHLYCELKKAHTQIISCY